MRSVLDIVRRLALRGPGVPLEGGAAGAPVATIVMRLDQIVTAAPAQRPVMLGQLLAQSCRNDPAAVELLRSTGLAQLLRDAVMARRGGQYASAEPLVVSRSPELAAPGVDGHVAAPVRG